jgi:hypothetical protein
VHFLESKAAYRDGRALVFHNIDYLMMTFKLMQKDYLYLASCLVPMGSQIGMSQQELADMLRTKTKRFTEEQIQAKFKAPISAADRKNASVALTVEDEKMGNADETLAAAKTKCRSRA